MGRGYHKLRRDWRDRIKVGDVLLERNKTQRVVREVSYRKDGFIWGVHFAIKRCSWTRRCYTVLCRSDLKQRGFVPAGARVRLDQPIDKKIARDLEYDNRFNQRLTCCDVEGVA